VLWMCDKADWIFPHVLPIVMNTLVTVQKSILMWLKTNKHSDDDKKDLYWLT
jgi:hypothetical protein